MLLRLRIELPDQPGSLGRVTWTLGVLGADVAQIYVLERDSGRALDDIPWSGVGSRAIACCRRCARFPVCGRSGCGRPAAPLRRCPRRE